MCRQLEKGYLLLMKITWIYFVLTYKMHENAKYTTIFKRSFMFHLYTWQILYILLDIIVYILCLG